MASAKRGFLNGYKTYSGPRGSADSWRAAFSERMGLDEARERVGEESPESILGVAVGASWSEIRTAFKRLAFECHPDRAAQNGMSVAAATEKFKRIVAAYTILEDRRR